MVVIEGDREALGNCVQLCAVACSRMTQQAQIPAHVVAQIPAHVVSCWRAPTFWVPAIHKGKRKKSVVAQIARALH